MLSQLWSVEQLSAPTWRNSPLRSSTSRQNPTTTRARRTPFIALSSALKRVGNLLRTASRPGRLSARAAQGPEMRSPVKRTDHDQASSSQNGETECSCLLRDEREARSRIYRRKASAPCERRSKGAWPGRLTVDSLFQVVHDEVKELIKALQRPGHCAKRQGRSIPPNRVRKDARAKCEEGNAPSRPPVNLTLICLSTYLARSRIASRRGRSSPPPLPALPPRPAPPRPPRPRPRPCRDGFSSTEALKDEARLTRASEFMAKGVRSVDERREGEGEERAGASDGGATGKEASLSPTRARRLLTRKRRAGDAVCRSQQREMSQL